MVDIFPIKFTATQTALAARVQDLPDLPQAVRDLGLPSPRPMIVLVGGGGRMTEADLVRLRPLFDEALAPIAQELDAVVVDGGTDAGVMRLMGQARAALARCAGGGGYRGHPSGCEASGGRGSSGIDHPGEASHASPKMIALFTGGTL